LGLRSAANRREKARFGRCIRFKKITVNRTAAPPKKTLPKKRTDRDQGAPPGDETLAHENATTIRRVLKYIHTNRDRAAPYRGLGQAQNLHARLSAGRTGPNPGVRFHWFSQNVAIYLTIPFGANCPGGGGGGGPEPRVLASGLRKRVEGPFFFVQGLREHCSVRAPGGGHRYLPYQAKDQPFTDRAKAVSAGYGHGPTAATPK